MPNLEARNNNTGPIRDHYLLSAGGSCAAMLRVGQEAFHCTAAAPESMKKSCSPRLQILAGSRSTSPPHPLCVCRLRNTSITAWLTLPPDFGSITVGTSALNDAESSIKRVSNRILFAVD